MRRFKNPSPISTRRRLFHLDVESRLVNNAKRSWWQPLTNWLGLLDREASNDHEHANDRSASDAVH
jgi:hypothetical protein